MDRRTVGHRPGGRVTAGLVDRLPESEGLLPGRTAPSSCPVVAQVGAEPVSGEVFAGPEAGEEVGGDEVGEVGGGDRFEPGHPHRAGIRTHLGGEH